MQDGKLKLDRRRLLLTGAAAIVAPAVLSAPAFAITPDEIKKRGKVIIGIQGDNPPWGYVDSSGKQQGLDSDVGLLYGKYLGVPVEFMPLEVANRIPALTSGRVDILFATMAMFPERAKAVQFSKPYAANIILLIAPKSVEVKSPPIWRSSRVSVSRAPPRKIRK
jgi:polar amino acid transport system substrate-binding protein